MKYFKSNFQLTSSLSQKFRPSVEMVAPYRQPSDIGTVSTFRFKSSKLIEGPFIRIRENIIIFHHSSEGFRINFDPLNRPSGGFYESLKNFDPIIILKGTILESKQFRASYPPFGRPWRIPLKTVTLFQMMKLPIAPICSLQAVSKNLLINFNSLIRPSGGLEESLNKLRPSFKWWNYL